MGSKPLPSLNSCPLIPGIEPRSQRALVLDEDLDALEHTERVLRAGGYAVHRVTDAPTAMQVSTEARPDVALLDLNLPNVEDEQLLYLLVHVLRLPVLLMSARSKPDDRAYGLERGADDYIAKPFYARELLARVRNLTRRAAAPASPPERVLRIGSLTIDLATRDVWVGGERIELTLQEFKLLLFLAANPDSWFSRAELLRHVWGSDVAWQGPSTVTEHVRRLRLKLGPLERHRIRTLRGYGYQLSTAPS